MWGGYEGLLDEMKQCPGVNCPLGQRNPAMRRVFYLQWQRSARRDKLNHVRKEATAHVTTAAAMVVDGLLMDFTRSHPRRKSIGSICSYAIDPCMQ